MHLGNCTCLGKCTFSPACHLLFLTSCPPATCSCQQSCARQQGLSTSKGSRCGSTDAEGGRPPRGRGRPRPRTALSPPPAAAVAPLGAPPCATLGAVSSAQSQRRASAPADRIQGGGGKRTCTRRSARKDWRQVYLPSPLAAGPVATRPAQQRQQGCRRRSTWGRHCGRLVGRRLAPVPGSRTAGGGRSLAGRSATSLPALLRQRPQRGPRPGPIRASADCILLHAHARMMSGAPIPAKLRNVAEAGQATPE